MSQKVVPQKPVKTGDCRICDKPIIQFIGAAHHARFSYGICPECAADRHYKERFARFSANYNKG